MPERCPLVEVPVSGMKLYLTTVASRASECDELFEWTVLWKKRGQDCSWERECMSSRVLANCSDERDDAYTLGERGELD